LNPNSKIATPNIDRLALQGIRLTDAHAPASVCVPSRYGLLTGRYMFRNRRVYTKEALIEPGRLTIASLLKRAGYTTAMIGKWHLSFEGGGHDPGGGASRGAAFDYRKPLRGGPTDHGFDSFFGMHASLDIAPYFFIENDRVVEAPTATVEEHRTPGVLRYIQGEFWRGPPPVRRQGGVVPREPGRIPAALLPVFCADGTSFSLAAGRAVSRQERRRNVWGLRDAGG
jgi:arylsulfatase A